MATSPLHITRFIHWAMALLLLTLIGVGFYMTWAEDHGLYPVHKSLGVCAMMALVFRLYWRSRYPWPSSATGTGQEWAARSVHTALLLMVLLMVMSGLAYSGLGGYGVTLFGLPLVPSNFSASGEAMPYYPQLSKIGQQVHGLAGYGFAALIGLHLLAALKHHFINRDDTLTRMLGKVPPG